MSVGEGERRQRYVVCHNPEEQTRQRHHRAKVLADLDAQLSTMKPSADGKLSARARELLTSGRFGKYLRQTDRGDLCVDRTAIRAEERYDGKWVITSNDDTLTSEDLALGYKQLLRVEQCWRQMKSGLKMRPVFHYLPSRIGAHVSICVLALLLERMAELRTGDTWRNLAAQLQKLQVIEYDRDGARIQQTTDVRPEAELLLKKLQVPLPPKLHSVVHIPASAPTVGAMEPTSARSAAPAVVASASPSSPSSAARPRRATQCNSTPHPCAAAPSRSAQVDDASASPSAGCASPTERHEAGGAA